MLVSKVTELDQSEVIQTSSSKYKIGNFFENFKLGQKIIHATPRTITYGDCALYTALYGSRYALHCSDEFAKRLSLEKSPIHDFLLFLSLIHI